MNNVTHLFDGKDIIIENDNLRRMTRSFKVNESVCRTINLTTPMGLCFEHTRAAVARGREKKIVQWWGSAVPHMLPLDEYQDYFVNYDISSPKHHWTAKKFDVTFESFECKPESMTEDEFIKDILNDANELIELENEFMSNNNNLDLSNKKGSHVQRNKRMVKWIVERTVGRRCEK